MTGERDLRALLEDAVADVEPAERLDDIRARVVVPPPRRWGYGVGGAVLAVAATVAAVAVVTLPGDDQPDAGTPMASSSPTASADATRSPSAGTGRSVAVYYVGDTPVGPRLFREWRPPVPVDRAPSEEIEALTAEPLDPDYRTYWPAGSIRAVGDPELGVVNVLLRDSLAERPAGMSEQDARIALQQLVYTVRAMYQEPVAVSFRLGDDPSPVQTVFGLDAGEVEPEPEVDVRASVNINDPVEGLTVSGGFTARGSANVFEGNVIWELRDGATVVREGFTTASGSITRHFPWEASVDVSGVEPGTYTFVATSQDVSDGEGFAPDVDTRTVVVE